MRTLGETIERVFDHWSELQHDDRCEILNYLREYKRAGIDLQKVKENINKYAELRVEYEDKLSTLRNDLNTVAEYLRFKEDNKPMAFTDFTQMIGKPVWIEFIPFSCGEWMLVYEVRTSCVRLHRANGRIYRHALLETMGREWNAYRQEKA